MREIKFRAWDTEEKRWWPKGHDEWINIAHNGTIIYGDSDGNPEDAEGRFEIAQFTGLLDMNGREIYEGDIVQVTETLVEVFEWVNPAAGFKTKRIDSKGRPVLSDLLPKWPHYEIIGNQFENPDLLK